MDKERHQDIDRILGSFQFSMLQDFVTFSTLCRRESIGIDEVAAYIEHEVLSQHVSMQRVYRQQMKIRQAIKDNFPHCPVCRRQLSVEEINDHPARTIDDHSHSWWICPDPFCSYEPEASDKFPYQILSEFGVPVAKPRIQQPDTRRAMAAATRRSGCSQSKRRRRQR